MKVWLTYRWQSGHYKIPLYIFVEDVNTFKQITYSVFIIIQEKNKETSFSFEKAKNKPIPIAINYTYVPSD